LPSWRDLPVGGGVTKPQQPLYRELSDGFTVRIKLTPKASKSEILGLCDTPEGRAVSAHVRAIPSEGAANAALETLLATWLGVPKSCVALTAGQKSRIKTVTVRGSLARLHQRLADFEPRT
jgi:uncharacterized protein